MIQTLKIINFQSHKDTQLYFDPGVNIIVGSTDSGKTAILRALRWLIWNRPSGDAFRSTWGGPTSVSVQMNADVVTRGKDKENVYKFNNKTYKAIGTNVPEDIQQVLNIDETNLQMQLDAPFLISKPPGEVSAYFNKVAHLDQIDTSLKAINKAYQALNSKKGHDEMQVEELKVDLATFDYLEKFEIELEVLEDNRTRSKQATANVNQLRTIIKDIEKIDADIAKKQLTIDFDERVFRLLAMWTFVDEKNKEASKLKATLEELHDIDVELAELKRKSKLLPQVVELLAMWNKQQALAKEIRELRSTGREIKEANTIIDKTDKKLEKLEVKFHKHMPDECPLCGFNSAGIN